MLNNTSKKLLAGVGAVKKQAKIIAPDEKDVLWSKGVYFCLRGGNEHR